VCVDGQDAADWAYQREFASYEVYRDFTGLTVTDAAGTTLATLIQPGKMRPRGQSTMFFPLCLGLDGVPYLIDVASSFSAQRLFGMEMFYLRNHLGDSSFMREWSMHRMLRRFGLPYLRTRTAKLHVNEEYVGTYTLMEAPDQDYIFYRGFGDKTPASPDYPPLSPHYALYKMKSMSIGCGLDAEEMEAWASAPLYTPPADPNHYAFKRGTHRKLVPMLGLLADCGTPFWMMIIRDKRDAVAAWLAHGKDCGKMLLDEGLVDLDLGSGTTNDPRMKGFINTFLADDAARGCRNATGGCAASALADFVDVDDFLKNFAVYAVNLVHIPQAYL